jgi:hypothetical protein
MTLCLLHGSNISPNVHRRPTSFELSIDAQYDNIDNDDGISVFDVTVPDRPRYAMIQLTESAYEVEDENGDDGAWSNTTTSRESSTQVTTWFATDDMPPRLLSPPKSKHWMICRGSMLLHSRACGHKAISSPD